MKHFISFIIIIFHSASLAHTPIEDSLLMGNSGTTGGYGYIPGRSGESEASAMRLFSNSCNTYCEIDPLPTNPSSDSDVMEVIETVEEDAIELQIFRSKC